MKRLITCIVGGTALCLSPAFLHAQDGAGLYRLLCASCHDSGNERAPTRATLRQMTAEGVLNAMENGPMLPMSSNRTTGERRALAEFVSGKRLSKPSSTVPVPDALCRSGAGQFTNPLNGPVWNGWGANTSNTRLQDNAAAGFTAADVLRLKVKWAFGFPGDITINAQPSVVGGRVFVGSLSGTVYALDAATGCVYWYFQAASAVRAAVSIGSVQTSSGSVYAAFIGDQAANVYAVNAATGKLLWKTRADNFPLARVTGSPRFYNGRLYVGIASGEESAGGTPDYECCRFRGSLIAFNAANGDQVWRTYTITEESRPIRKNQKGVQQWGPSGAPIWTSPAIDPQHNALYVATGDNYSDPPTANSDAFMAFDLDTGKVLWTRQMTAADAWNTACRLSDKTNCPESDGPDFDFASSPILVTLANGRRALIAGQKSGVVHALDPDRNGEVLWSTRVGKGGTLGGVQWGSAVDQSNVYVALSDIARTNIPNSQGSEPDPKAGGGMFALRLDNGERVWYTPPADCGDRRPCSPAQSAAVSAIPGVAFSGSVDGHLRGYSMADGKVVWDFDTVRAYDTVNKVQARGGSLNGPGPAIAGGMLFVTSGYANNGIPGNVLLAFSVDGN